MNHSLPPAFTFGFGRASSDLGGFGEQQDEARCFGNSSPASHYSKNDQLGQKWSSWKERSECEKVRKILMVAEKPISAEEIAKILSKGRCRRRGFEVSGKKGGNAVHEWTGEFEGQPAHFQMTSTNGHLMMLDFEKGHEDWRRTDPLELFTCGTVTEAREGPKYSRKSAIEASLAAEACGCSDLVLWLDCDREGEHICFEVIQAVKERMVDPWVSDEEFIKERVHRARFSAFSVEAIEGAMKNLGKPNMNEYLAVHTRQLVDFRVGCGFTRLLSTKFLRKYEMGEHVKCISYGPCQTPVLALCVARHEEIQCFVPKKAWTIATEMRNGRLEMGTFIEATSGLFSIQDDAQLELDRVLASVAKCGVAVVIEVMEKEIVLKKPLPLSGNMLLKVASSILGISSQECENHRQSLYEKGWTTYPRTETTAYPEGFNEEIPVILRMLAAGNSCSPAHAEKAKEMEENGTWDPPRQGIDRHDHPPIIPMRRLKGNYMKLSEEEKAIHNYVVAHFLATLMPSCRYTTRKVMFAIGEDHQLFTAHSQTMIEAGFTTIMSDRELAVISDGHFSAHGSGSNGLKRMGAILPPSTTSQLTMSNSASPCSNALDRLQCGESLFVGEVRLEERQTIPPNHYTEPELIGAMERERIGTDASIPTHIHRNVEREYIRVVWIGDERRLVPTHLGLALINGIGKVDKKLVETGLRARMEKQIDLIARGEANHEFVLKKLLDEFMKRFVGFSQQASLCVLENEFERSFKKREQHNKQPVYDKARGQWPPRGAATQLPRGTRHPACASHYEVQPQTLGPPCATIGQRLPSAPPGRGDWKKWAAPRKDEHSIASALPGRGGWKEWAVPKKDEHSTNNALSGRGDWKKWAAPRKDEHSIASALPGRGGWKEWAAPRKDQHSTASALPGRGGWKEWGWLAPPKEDEHPTTSVKWHVR